MFLDTSYNPIAMSIASAADYIGVGRTTVYKLIRNGALESMKVGRRRLVTIKSIVGLISLCRTAVVADRTDAEYGGPTVFDFLTVETDAPRSSG